MVLNMTYLIAKKRKFVDVLCCFSVQLIFLLVHKIFNTNLKFVVCIYEQNQFRFIKFGIGLVASSRKEESGSSCTFCFRQIKQSSKISSAKMKSADT